MIVRKAFFTAVLLVFSFAVIAQPAGRPKLVVGIVVDQMRADYVDRYWQNFGDDGFKRLWNEGFQCRNHQFSYMPTYTGPGHTSVYTGTTPAVHGIIANNWFERESEGRVYCASDPTVKGIGVEGRDGRMSPHRVMSSMVADELKLSVSPESKVIGISLKDRGAIMPAGHTGDAAYWMVDGRFVSSSYYMDELPNWVEKFNKNGALKDYLKEGWSLMLDREEYVTALEDDNPYEGVMNGRDKPTFPYRLNKLKDDNYGNDIIKGTPMGNSILVDFALQAMDQEGMGSDEVTDLLALSFSAPDYVGHRFGTFALETEDTYIRLDRELARLFEKLDEKVGKGNYLLFLTADHGAQNVPSHMMDLNIPAGYQEEVAFMNGLDEWLQDRVGVGREVVMSLYNEQIFLDKDTIRSQGKTREEVGSAIVEYVRHHSDAYYDAVLSDEVRLLSTGERPYSQLFHGFHPMRSGDILLVPKVGFIDYGKTGTTHGSPWVHDTHVPMVWYGWNVQQGSTSKPTHIRDIAPTLATMLRISWPTGTTGQPIDEVVGE